MNLLAITAGAIAAVNPTVLCTVKVSTGYTVAADGTQVPTYATTTGVPAQVQALGYTDTMKLGGLNIEGIRRAIYFNGNVEGLDRQAIKGGDLIIMPSLPGFAGPTTWLVAQQLEWWPDWSKVAATLQVTP